MKAYQSTLLLIGIAAGLGYVLWATRDRGTPDQGAGASLLDGRRVGEARRITIHRSLGLEPSILEPDGTGRFRIVEPIVDLASMSFLENLAQVYDSAQVFEAYPGEEPDAALLANTGLDQPRARLELRFEDRELRIDIGGAGPLGADLFLRRGGRILRGGAALYSALQANPDDLRERLVFRTTPREVQAITMRRRTSPEREETFRVEVRGGQVFLVEPLTARADPDLVFRLVTALLGMRVDRFLPGVMNTPADPPDVALEVRGPFGTETVELWTKVSNSASGRHRERRMDFQVDVGGFNQAFTMPLDALRERPLVPLAESQVERLTVDPGKGSPRLVLRPGIRAEFALFAPVEAPADPVAVGEALRAVTQLVASEFVSGGAPAEFGLAEGFTRVEVAGGQGMPPVVVHLGRDEGDVTYAQRAGEAQVVKVPKAAADALRRPWTRYMERVALRLPTWQLVQRLVVRSEGRPVAAYQRGPDGTWRREGESAARTDVREVLELLSDLRAERVLDPATAGAPRGGFHLELSTDNGDVLLEAEVIPEGERALFRSNRVAALFELRGIESRAILALTR